MMKRTERFATLAEFLAEKQRLAAQRDRHAARIEQHWAEMKSGKFRRKLAGKTLKSALGGWKPAKVLGSVLGAGTPAFAAGLASRLAKGGWPLRLAFVALELAAPGLLERLSKLRREDVLREVGVSMDRIRDHLRSRKRTDGTANEDPTHADDTQRSTAEAPPA